MHIFLQLRHPFRHVTFHALRTEIEAPSDLLHLLQFPDNPESLLYITALPWLNTCDAELMSALLICLIVLLRQHPKVFDQEVIGFPHLILFRLFILSFRFFVLSFRFCIFCRIEIDPCFVKIRLYGLDLIEVPDLSETPVLFSSRTAVIYPRSFKADASIIAAWVHPILSCVPQTPIVT